MTSRRRFLRAAFAATACGIALPVSAAEVEELQRFEDDVYFSGVKFRMGGWKVRVNEHVSWDLWAWNGGAETAAVVVAQPGSFNTPWSVIHQPIVERTAKKLIMREIPSNEDLVFCVEGYSARTDNSNAGIIDGGRAVHMSWNRPQEVHLELRLTSRPLGNDMVGQRPPMKSIRKALDSDNW